MEGLPQASDFHVAFGQLPDDTHQLAFKALQTYSDGKTVRWIEKASGGEEPENPTPILKLTAKVAADDEGASTASATPSTTKNFTSASASAADGSDSTARGLGIAGLVVGVLGLVAAAFALLCGRSAAGRGE